VIRQRAVVPRPDVDDAETVHEELRQLPDATRHVLGIGPVGAGVGADVGDARAGRRDDRVEPREDLDVPPSERPSVIRVAGVEVELAAAGLAPGKDDLQPAPLENRDDRNVIVQVWGVGDEEGAFPSLERLNVYTGSRTKIARSPVRNSFFTTDAAGEVRFVQGETTDNRAKLYQRAGGDWNQHHPSLAASRDAHRSYCCPRVGTVVEAGAA
jgi:hypothetical protein